MFLLEVYDKSIYSGRPSLFKRRIAHDISSIEDWIKTNAPKWAILPVEVVFDDDDCSGEVYLRGEKTSPIFTFCIHNIAVI